MDFKILIIVFVSFFFGQNSEAQTTDTALYAVRYAFIHMRDTANPEKLYFENMVLYVGAKASMYDSEDRIVQDSILEKNTIETISPDGRRIISGGGYKKKPVTISTLYQFNGIKKMFIDQHYLDHDYVMETPIPVINWAVTADTKKIGGIACQKATGICKGRTYEVWFAPDIPYTTGPWKLSGLPGLIVEAYDTKKQVSFLFSGFEKITTKKNLIQLPHNATYTSTDDFKKMFEETQGNPLAAIKIALGGADFKPVDPNTTIKNPAKKSAINNPIELPEK